MSNKTLVVVALVIVALFFWAKMGYKVPFTSK